ncbi:MAG: purine-cytosine permease family protein, partial [Nocardioidaceae bacterium]
MSAATASGPFEVQELEQTLQPIPEGARTRRVSGQFWIWCGANIAPINWVLGALGINLGLGLRDTLIVLVVGNLIGMALFGFFVLLGQRSGATAMVLSRAAFGRRGNYLPATIQAALSIGWCAINTWIILDLVMALLAKLGVVEAGANNYGAKIVVAALLMLTQVVISWFGYKAIATFERWTVPPTIAILVAMSVMAWFFLDIDWSYAGPAGEVLTGTPRLAAMTAVMTAIGIGWGITWFTYAADYSRFVSREVPKRRLYVASVFGQFLPVVWLGVLGATLATKSGTIDPGQLIVQNYGALAIPV